jgi:hypothetical protein
MKGDRVADDYDSPWKEAIDQLFADFLLFFFPHAHAQVDWSQPHVFLEQELRRIVPESLADPLVVDKLARVTRRDGAPDWIFIHLEVQGSAQQEFARRMFVYNYRLFDRFQVPIASLAVLADDRKSWRPDQFNCESLGCKVSMHFPVAKLLDWSGSESRLEDSQNPFAVVTLAHLSTRQTRDDAAARKQAKWQLIKRLYQRGWGTQQVLALFKVIDWMMRLPKELDQELRQDLYEWEGKMSKPYVTSFERLAREEGIQRGMQQGVQQGRREAKTDMLVRLMTRRFGSPPSWAMSRVEAASEVELDAWIEALVVEDSIESVFASARLAAGGSDTERNQ